MRRELTYLGAGLVLFVAAIATPALAQSGLAELPPNAKAGECYAKVLAPAVYKTEMTKVTKKEAAERIEIIPAKYEWAEEKVLVKEGYEKISVIPATYKWVEEKVMIAPATSEVKEIPAVYAWVEEKILVKPSQVVWKKGRGAAERIDNATGEIMCRVEEPAVHKVVKKRVLKTPVKTSKVDIPAKYKTVRKQVIDRPESTKKVNVPAQHTIVKVKKLVTPPQEKRVPVPAEFAEVTKQVKVSDGKLEWRPVLCQTNMGRDLVTSIQRALKSAGHNPGPIDGVIGSQTMQATAAFQSAKGLARGALTMDTLNALGVKVSSN